MVMKERAYPKPDSESHGCKVSWYYYADEKKARKASEIAKYNARIKLGQGYDFGYQVPGTCTKIHIKTSPHFNLWEVCLP